LSQLKQKIGKVLAEFTPADLTALLDDLAINQIATSKVETGIQQKSYL
ncbi:RNA-guided endonuclease TnpB family protein, partial [Campylobacter jejuni]|nr:transposase [Campylobacter jejuni]EAI8671547.1 transposase [Campylobacter jejuni]EAM0229820.1 transposase [Campylobacter jejuni]EAM0235056.1 transposase [Campylobacter jejuni]EAM0968208.1 transposase [Campylobacter jejuni]